MKKDLTHLYNLLRRPVTLIKTSGAKYGGVLSKVNPKKMTFCLTDLKIVNKSGGITASKQNTVRWFRVKDISILEHNP